MTDAEKEKAKKDPDAALERMKDLTRKILAVPKAELPTKRKPKRKGH